MISDQIGREAELLVQKNLWRRNYRVKDVSRMRMGYDILVEEKYKVEIKSMNGTTTTVRLNPRNFNILCVVIFNSLGSSIYYLKNKRFLKSKDMNGGDVTKISLEIIKKYFTKKPNEIFIKKTVIK